MKPILKGNLREFGEKEGKIEGKMKEKFSLEGFFTAELLHKILQMEQKYKEKQSI